MNLIHAADAHLNGRWAAARSRTSGRRLSLWQGLAESLGCAPGLTPVAYREHVDLAQRLRLARAAIEDEVDDPLELWDIDPARTWADVHAVLLKVGATVDVTVPDPPTLWPWCQANRPSECRMPSVLFGAVAAVALDRPNESLAHILIDGFSSPVDPWSLLGSIEPHVPSAVDVGSVRALRDELNARYRDQVDRPLTIVADIALSPVL